MLTSAVSAMLCQNRSDAVTVGADADPLYPTQASKNSPVLASNMVISLLCRLDQGKHTAVLRREALKVHELIVSFDS